MDTTTVRIEALRLALHRIANHKDTLAVKKAIADLALRADDGAIAADNSDNLWKLMDEVFTGNIPDSVTSAQLIEVAVANPNATNDALKVAFKAAFGGAA